MTKYVLTYHGEPGMPETEEEMSQVMAAWGAWFESLGDSIVDGGAPFGPASSVGPDGSASDSGQGLSGYSIIEAASMDAAVEAARGCPVLANGHTVSVNEALDM
jgi:hypothetical protein